MATEVVQFREDAEALEYLRSKGINPNEFAREAFERLLERVRTEEAMESLAARKIRLPRSVEDMIREDRDSR